MCCGERLRLWQCVVAFVGQQRGERRQSFAKLWRDSRRSLLARRDQNGKLEFFPAAQRAREKRGRSEEKKNQEPEGQLHFGRSKGFEKYIARSSALSCYRENTPKEFRRNLQNPNFLPSLLAWSYSPGEVAGEIGEMGGDGELGDALFVTCETQTPSSRMSTTRVSLSNMSPMPTVRSPMTARGPFGP